MLASGNADPAGKRGAPRGVWTARATCGRAHSTAGYAEIHVVVFVVPNPGLLLVEGKVAHYLTPGLCRSKPRLQVDVEDDASNADAMRVGCAFECQQMERHRFEIDRVAPRSSVVIELDGVAHQIERRDRQERNLPFLRSHRHEKISRSAVGVPLVSGETTARR